MMNIYAFRTYYLLTFLLVPLVYSERIPVRETSTRETNSAHFPLHSNSYEENEYTCDSFTSSFENIENSKQMCFESTKTSSDGSKLKASPNEDHQKRSILENKVTGSEPNVLDIDFKRKVKLANTINNIFQIGLIIIVLYTLYWLKFNPFSFLGYTSLQSSSAIDYLGKQCLSPSTTVHAIRLEGQNIIITESKDGFTCQVNVLPRASTNVESSKIEPSAEKDAKIEAKAKVK